MDCDSSSEEPASEDDDEDEGYEIDNLLSRYQMTEEQEKLLRDILGRSDYDTSIWDFDLTVSNVKQVFDGTASEQTIQRWNEAVAAVEREAKEAAADEDMSPEDLEAEGEEEEEVESSSEIEWLLELLMEWNRISQKPLMWLDVMDEIRDFDEEGDMEIYIATIAETDASFYEVPISDFRFNERPFQESHHMRQLVLKLINIVDEKLESYENRLDKWAGLRKSLQFVCTAIKHFIERSFPVPNSSSLQPEDVAMCVGPSSELSRQLLAEVNTVEAFIEEMDLKDASSSSSSSSSVQPAMSQYQLIEDRIRCCHHFTKGVQNRILTLLKPVADETRAFWRECLAWVATQAEQQNVELVLPTDVFKNLIITTASDYKNQLRFEDECFPAIQAAAEQYLMEFLRGENPQSRLRGHALS